MFMNLVTKMLNKPPDWRLSLEKKGKKIKRTGIMIASTVINKGATLYTFDNDFQALEDFGLKIIR